VRNKGPQFERKTQIWEESNHRGNALGELGRILSHFINVNKTLYSRQSKGFGDPEQALNDMIAFPEIHR
jgi:hypothetical protein